MSVAVIHDAEGRIVGEVAAGLPDATAYLTAEMARQGIAAYVLADDPPDQEAQYVAGGAVVARPVLPDLVPGPLPWAVPQAAGQTVTVINESGDSVSSADAADPVVITEPGTYRLHVEAWPAQDLRQEVEIA